jgi:hypothetical protein
MDNKSGRERREREIGARFFNLARRRVGVRCRVREGGKGHAAYTD